MRIHMKSIFARRFKDETFIVDKASNVYAFFKTECPNEITKDQLGNLIVRRERLQEIRRNISRIIDFGSDSYSYFKCEYRQNSPVQDSFGNIIINDEIATEMTR